MDKPHSLEQAYYLPPASTGLEQEWQQNADQARYAELCQRGHDMVANAIIEGRRTGHTPTVKELYAIAAKVRRAIAWLTMKDMPSDEPNYRKHQYGMPFIHHERTGDCRLRDEIGSEQGHRYQQFYADVVRRFDELKMMDPALFDQAFGHAYHMEHKENPRYESVVISRTGKTVAAMQRQGGSRVYFSHATVQDQDGMFEEADKHLSRIIQGRLPEKAFWQEMGAIALELYHAGPLRLGSQTTTLMVLAGITKAMGREVVPITLPTDHFIEAELMPYQAYIDGYGSRFIHPPRQSEPPTQAFAVDMAFLEEAAVRMQGSNKAKDPVTALSHYLTRVCGDEMIEVKSFTVTQEGRIQGLETKRVDNNAFLQRALDFIGPEAAGSLGLAPGNYVHRPVQRITDRFEDGRTGTRSLR